MNLLTQIAGMVVGFTTVMLAASLVVSVLVRIVHYLGDKRSKTLGEMLGALNQAFRADRGDHARPGDVPQTTFVLDILTYPTLHLSSDLKAITTPKARDLDVHRQREALAKRVEYLTEANLIEIVTRLTAAETPPLVGRPRSAWELGKSAIPARWYDRIQPNQPTLDELKAFITTWYRTIERVGTQDFVLASRRLTAVISCIVVVLLCLDGIQLGVDLFRGSSKLNDHLAEQGLALLNSPTQAEAIHPSGHTAAERDPNLHDLEASLTQVNSVLNEPGLNLGWQNSWMVKEIGRVARKAPDARTGVALWLDVFRWLLGLVLSCLLVSLGAPFWADQLSALLNLRNATAPPKRNKKSGSELEHSSRSTSAR